MNTSAAAVETVDPAQAPPPPPPPPRPRSAEPRAQREDDPERLDLSGRAGAAPLVGSSGDAIGMPILVAGSIAFALAVAGYVPVGALAPVLIISVVGEIVAARWAFRDGRTGPARIYAAFAGFWLSYTGLVLGLSNAWFGIAPEETSLAIALFVITWLTAMLMVTVANLELPLVHTLILVAVDLALGMLLAGTLLGMDVLFTAAGVALLVSTVLAAYACVATTGPVALRRALPLGAPVVSPRPEMS